MIAAPFNSKFDWQTPRWLTSHCSSLHHWGTPTKNIFWSNTSFGQKDGFHGVFFSSRKGYVRNAPRCWARAVRVTGACSALSWAARRSLHSQTFTHIRSMKCINMWIGVVQVDISELSLVVTAYLVFVRKFPSVHKVLECCENTALATTAF